MIHSVCHCEGLCESSQKLFLLRASENNRIVLCTQIPNSTQTGCHDNIKGAFFGCILYSRQLETNRIYYSCLARNKQQLDFTILASSIDTALWLPAYICWLCYSQTNTYRIALSNQAIQFWKSKTSQGKGCCNAMCSQSPI